jgi:hypothetical protein
LRPIRSPTLLLIRMKAAETNASSAIADCTPLAVVFKSLITAEIDTFISDVSTTRTNIAMANRTIKRRLAAGAGVVPVGESLITLQKSRFHFRRGDTGDGDHPRPRLRDTRPAHQNHPTSAADPESAVTCPRTPGNATGTAQQRRQRLANADNSMTCRNVPDECKIGSRARKPPI